MSSVFTPESPLFQEEEDGVFDERLPISYSPLSSSSTSSRKSNKRKPKTKRTRSRDTGSNLGAITPQLVGDHEPTHYVGLVDDENTFNGEPNMIMFATMFIHAMSIVAYFIYTPDMLNYGLSFEGDNDGDDMTSGTMIVLVTSFLHIWYVFLACLFCRVYYRWVERPAKEHLLFSSICGMIGILLFIYATTSKRYNKIDDALFVTGVFTSRSFAAIGIGAIPIEPLMLRYLSPRGDTTIRRQFLLKCMLFFSALLFVIIVFFLKIDSWFENQVILKHTFEINYTNVGFYFILTLYLLLLVVQLFRYVTTAARFPISYGFLDVESSANDDRIGGSKVYDPECPVKDLYANSSDFMRTPKRYTAAKQNSLLFVLAVHVFIAFMVMTSFVFRFGNDDMEWVMIWTFSIVFVWLMIFEFILANSMPSAKWMVLTQLVVLTAALTSIAFRNSRSHEGIILMSSSLCALFTVMVKSHNQLAFLYNIGSHFLYERLHFLVWMFVSSSVGVLFTMMIWLTNESFHIALYVSGAELMCMFVSLNWQHVIHITPDHILEGDRHGESNV